MKAYELFEAKEIAAWVQSENSDFQNLLKRFNLKYRKKPFMHEGRWVFGGEIEDTEKEELTLSIDKRLAGAQKAVAKHLFNLHQEGREVVIYQPAKYGYGRGRAGVWAHIPVEFTPRMIYADDTLPAVEALVKDRMMKNTVVDGSYSILFQYSVSEPKPKEEPKAPEKKVYRVVKAEK